MKTITINNVTLEYEVVEQHDYDTHLIETNFYQGTKAVTKTRRKYWLFGEELTKTKLIPNFAFRLPFNIESTDYTKESVRHSIEAKIYLLGRKLEIERGEII